MITSKVQGLSDATAPVVVVVEDDPAVRNSLKFSLEIEGYSVRLYSGGRDLLDHGELPRHGCLVIDYSMPDMNGIDLLAALRARNCALPAILMTGDPTVMLRELATAVGARFIEKPLIGGALVEAIDMSLSHQPHGDR
jgi:FixJ family two-component response regulator